MHDLFSTVVAWYMEHINYYTVCLLMTIESSFIPFPSEVVIPPAAWKAAQGELNIYLVLLWGNVGAMLGAYINYFLAITLGRKIVHKLASHRYAKLLLIDEKKIIQSEEYFNKHGAVATLVGRLLPAIRQLVSIPAGLARMKLWKFSLYTFIGAGLWNLLLAILGFTLYGQKERLELYYREITYSVVALVFVALTIFLVREWRRRS